MALPPDPEAMRRIGALIRSRRIPEAMEIARRELDRGAEHPQLLHLRSTWLEQQGRPLDALADLTRARELGPNELPVLMALGDLLAKLNRRVDARDAFLRASTLRPDFPGPLFQLGFACESIGEVEKAEAAYRKVLEVDPSHAQAAGRLAWIAGQQGDWLEARARAERAVQLNPKDAFAQLAYARADAQEGRWPEAEKRLEALLRESLPTEQFYLAQHELGALRHRQARYAEAFAAWRAGNDAVHRRYAPYFSGSRGAPALLKWLTQHFAAESAWQPSPPPARQSPPATHVFLMGFTRSGTTLLEQVLAGHPAVVAMEEKEVLTAAVEAFQSSPEKLGMLRSATEAELAPLRDAYWREVARFDLKPEGKVFIDKSPFSGLRLPLIARLFPEAKVLFALRDPRDVIFSSFRTAMRTTGLPYELLKVESAGRFYAAYMALTEIYREKLPLDLLDVRHEDLLDDFEGEVRRVCAFVGLEFDPAMLAFENSARKVATPSAHQLRHGLSRAGVGQWRHYAAEMEPALPHLSRWIERFGYAE